MSLTFVNSCILAAKERNEIDIILHVTNTQNKHVGISERILDAYPAAKKADLDTIALHREEKTRPWFSSDDQNVVTVYGFEHFGRFNSAQWRKTNRQIHYGEFVAALVSARACLNNQRIGIPLKSGSSGSGGDWDVIKELYEGIFSDFEITVHVPPK